MAEITGIQADNYLVVDLQSFTKVIDNLGGIDIEVEKAIYDAAYPGPDRSYTIFSIDKGWQHMDGELALKYARSRKSSSDFDRSKRQHKVIAAIQARLKELSLWDNLEKFVQFYLAIKDNIKTDLDLFKALSSAKNYQDFTLETGNVLSTANYLYSTVNQNGQYVLLPKSGDYTEIGEWVKKIVEE